MGTITITDGTEIFHYRVIAHDRCGHGRSTQTSGDQKADAYHG
jgi:hypothetical protein